MEEEEAASGGRRREPGGESHQGSQEGHRALGDQLTVGDFTLKGQVWPEGAVEQGRGQGLSSDSELRRRGVGGEAL